VLAGCCEVLELYDDLELAVSEGVPALAHDFFSTVKVQGS
jgi:hypothetical protein